VFTRQPSQAMNKRLLMLFEIFFSGRLLEKNVKQNSQMGQKKFFSLHFHSGKGGEQEGRREVRSLIRLNMSLTLFAQKLS
jgi:hypothetical protein